MTTKINEKSPKFQRNLGLLFKKEGSYLLSRIALQYHRRWHCSTIGDGGLNFSVRDGKRWDPAAIAT